MISMETNRIIQGDCLTVMRTLPSNYVDMILTSPPYDDLRVYGGQQFTFSKEYPIELFRVLKEGGVCVWIVNDKVEDGSETLSSFKQALAFKEAGFKVHDTMIYRKDCFPSPQSNRYLQCFEYMFVFSKGVPKTFNPIRITTRDWKPSKKSTKRYPNGEKVLLKYGQKKDYRHLENIWEYGIGYMKSSQDLDAFKHPATFPEDLAKDHILSWSNEGDLLLDPFVGSGTSAVIARKLNRHYIGIEINPEYCDIANKRLTKIPAYLESFLGFNHAVNRQ